MKKKTQTETSTQDVIKKVQDILQETNHGIGTQAHVDGEGILRVRPVIAPITPKPNEEK